MTAIILYILGAYMTWLFCINLNAERNGWLVLIIVGWPLPAAFMMLAGGAELFTDWWENRDKPRGD